MANDNNMWSPLSQAYTGSNHGDQPQSDSGGGRGNGSGRGNGVHEEPSVVINNSSNDDQQQSDSGFSRGIGGGRGNGVREEPSVVINSGSNDGNNGNRNNIVFGDGYSNIGVAEPATGDPRYKQWKSENSLIIVWLVSSMETGIGKPYMFLPSAKDVWEAVKETYSDIQNSSQIFGLKSKLWHAKQEDSVLFLKRQENDCVFMFLAGLNKDLDEVRGKVLGKVPLPTLREIFAEIRREEARQGIMMGKTQRNSESEGSALATRNLDEGRRSDKVPWCDHCKRE
ncbi:hypothetical protein KIW84_031648 [Lathyrus oleraceus]|uniref:Retrotransposon Copia-like N-terminal domain-containing protein n=1 Tax=Pisum sativum TaxID=3888 RepID=A0A9D4XTL3_PEA|nr:hypothetical protein KIW84_031648 [Pisum sativum]